jgi:hypothetical protein
VPPPPVCLERGKLVTVVVTPRRTLSKQSLRGQVSVKPTPEICINKASSNSRLTALGRWATASDSHSQNCLQTLFFSPYLWWDNNLTTPACWKTYWNCIASELGTLCCVLVFLLVWFFPFWWDNDRTTSKTPSPEFEAEGLTPKLLRLKLYCIWTCRFLKIFILFIFYSLCLYNACLAYCWLVHYLSLYISLTWFFFVSFVFFKLLFTCLFLFLYLLCFPSPYTLPF